MLFLVLLLLAAKGVVVAEGALCPEPCVCPNKTEAICSNRFLQGMNEEFDFSLQKLDFSGNMILTLDDTTLSSWGVENVQSLNMSNNIITEITEYAFLGLNRLRILDLSRNNITTIHPDTFCFNDLKFLSLAKNQISEMPLLTFWNDDIALSVLDLSQNEITNIQPKAFSNFTNLETLLLANNNISSLPSMVFQYNTKLTLLDLQGNSLTDLESDTFKTQQNLRTLILSDNQLWSLKPNAFSGCTNLLNLSISENLITSIHSDTFKGLTHLEHLDLSSNKLRDVNYQAFQYLAPQDFVSENTSVSSTYSRIQVYKVSKLQSVNLSRNRIKYLNLQTCFPIVSKINGSVAFKNLETLDLSRNMLNSLDDMTVEWLNSSDLIPNFSHNPWKCECGIYHDSIKLLMKKITLVCESPFKYYGRNWTVLEICPPRPTTTAQSMTSAPVTKRTITKDHFTTSQVPKSVTPKVRSKGAFEVTIAHVKNDVVRTTSAANNPQTECRTLKTSIAVFFLGCILIIVGIVVGKRLFKKRKYEAVAAFNTPSKEDSPNNTTHVNTVSSTDCEV